MIKLKLSKLMCLCFILTYICHCFFKVLLYALIRAFVGASFLSLFFVIAQSTICFAFVLRSTLHRVLGIGQERYSVSRSSSFSLFLTSLQSNISFLNIIFSATLLLLALSPVRS